MSTVDNSSILHFDIHPSVVFQLGETLISDVAQALIELVKNSYDADASYAKVTVNTRDKVGEWSYYRNTTGYIIIEDDGIGMDLPTIERGWLTVSNSIKREMKRNKLITERGRTPLGDKGLGRLGAQRLGYNVEIFTRPEGQEIEYHIAFSWNDFLLVQALTEVPIYFRINKCSEKRGTKLVISALKDVDFWQGSAVSVLESSLSQLISPYKEVRDFTIVANINGRRLELAEYGEQLKNLSIINYILKFDGEELCIDGKMKLGIFKQNMSNEDKDLFRTLVENDAGEQLFQFLEKDKSAERFSIRRLGEPNWYVGYRYRRKLRDITDISTISGEVANPGRFNGEVDSFNLRETVGLFGSNTESKNFIKSLGGIRVFRDGFGIRMGKDKQAQDWLGLGSQQTYGSSFYGLRPENTVGYVALSAKENAVLEETTDREGFSDTPYYENFYLMLQEFVKFSGEAQAFVRRGWLKFRDKHKEQIAGLEPGTTPEALSQKIGDSLSNASQQEASLRKTKETLEQAVQDTQQMMKFVEETSIQNTIQGWSVQATTQAFRQTVDQAKKEVDQVEEYLQRLSRLKAESEILHSQIEALREQLSQTFETIGLALTAESLSHEIATILDNLAYRNRQTMDYLKAQGIKDRKIISFTEYINTCVSALRKQLVHLAPSLRYVREKKEEIILADFLKDVQDYYQERFSRYNIELQLKKNTSSDFSLFMNRGKLNQIFDNLLLNSEYWLREDLRLKRIEQGIITVEISKPFVKVYDNGRGIEPSVEPSLFEPFVTTKGKGTGRGLGLYIIQQLLASEGCTISLIPKRNGNNHLYVFEIDFTGGLSGKDGN